MVTAERMKDLIAAHIDAEMRGDLDAIMATMTAECSHGNRDAAGCFRGADAVRAHYAKNYSVPSANRVSGLRVWPDELSQSAAAYLCIESSADATRFPLMGVFEFAGGLIANEHPFFDSTLPALSALSSHAGSNA